MRNFKRAACLGTALVVVLAAGAADAATLRGRVIDAGSRAALPGATVRVQGSDVRATTDRDGSFTVEGVADGQQTLSVDYVGYGTATLAATAADASSVVEVALRPADADAAGTIVVTGNRLAERRALQTKLAANNTVEALYANDVGKLPDQNVAEAVKRLPGLSVANDQGEGRYVIIRGINPNLVNVTLNGQTLPAPEPDGRQVKLDDIPSAMIGSVVVTKSLTADQDANAIGGEVDIRTLTAFDRNRPFFLDARGSYGRYDLNGRHPWEADAQVGGLFGADQTFGAVLSVNYSRRPIESENFQGSTDFNDAGQPDEFGLRDYNLVRTRLGVVANLDWHPNDATKLFLKASYSRFTDNETRDQNRVDNMALTGDETGTYKGRGSILVRRREEKDNTRSVELGGNFDVGAGHLDLAGTYTRAIKNDPFRSEFNFRTSSSSAISGSYDLGESPYRFGFAAPFAPASFPLNSVNYDHRHAQEDLYQARADYSLPVAIGDGSTIKVGGKYLDRHKTNDRDYQQYSLTKGTTFTAANAAFTGDTDFYGDDFVFGPRIDYDVAQAYVLANPSVLAQSTSNLTSTRNNSLVDDYDVREKIAAGYVMATLKFGDFTLVPGVRVEHTKDSNKAKLITATSTASDDYNSFGGTTYTNWFPGVNARLISPGTSCCARRRPPRSAVPTIRTSRRSSPSTPPPARPPSPSATRT